MLICYFLGFFIIIIILWGMLVGVGVGDRVGGWKVDKISIGKEMTNDKMLGLRARIKYLGYLIL